MAIFAKKIIMNEILILVALFVVFLAVLGYIHYKQNLITVEDQINKQLVAQLREQEKQANKENELKDAKYGVCTYSIGRRDGQSNTFRVYEDAGIILIEDEAYKFDEILSFNISHPDSPERDRGYSLKTDNKDLFKRAAVGMALGGAAGAAIGATTAKKDYKKNDEFDFGELLARQPILYIYTSRINNPLISIKWQGCSEEEICALFTAIMNKSRNQTP